MTASATDALAQLPLGAAGSVHLIGGGWDSAASGSVYGPFLEQTGPQPTIACVVIDEGDGLAQFHRWEAVLLRIKRSQPVPVIVRLGDCLDVRQLADADALFVCGGLTPAYAEAMVPVAPQIRAWLADGPRPYAGFSAGAAIAATLAVVGGWRHQGREVCPEDAAEDLDEVTVRPGLGLVDVTVDIHCSQWGTLPRLLAALADRPGSAGLAIDENTALNCYPDGTTVTGTGKAWRVTSGNASP